MYEVYDTHVQYFYLIFAVTVKSELCERTETTAGKRSKGHVKVDKHNLRDMWICEIVHQQKATDFSKEKHHVVHHNLHLYQPRIHPSFSL